MILDLKDLDAISKREAFDNDLSFDNLMQATVGFSDYQLGKKLLCLSIDCYMTYRGGYNENEYEVSHKLNESENLFADDSKEFWSGFDSDDIIDALQRDEEYVQTRQISTTKDFIYAYQTVEILAKKFDEAICSVLDNSEQRWYKYCYVHCQLPTWKDFVEGGSMEGLVITDSGNPLNQAYKYLSLLCADVACMIASVNTRQEFNDNTFNKLVEYYLQEYKQD